MRVGSLEVVHLVVEVEVLAIEVHVMVVVAGIEEEIEKESETETESRKNGATAGIESDTVQLHPNRCSHRCR